jgi:hypothetical protein
MSQHTYLADALPGSVSVTVGSGGAGGTGYNSDTGAGVSGGSSYFGTNGVKAGGGEAASHSYDYCYGGAGGYGMALGGSGAYGQSVLTTPQNLYGNSGYNSYGAAGGGGGGNIYYNAYTTRGEPGSAASNPTGIAYAVTNAFMPGAGGYGGHTVASGNTNSVEAGNIYGGGGGGGSADLTPGANNYYYGAAGAGGIVVVITWFSA